VSVGNELARTLRDVQPKWMRPPTLCPDIGMSSGAVRSPLIVRGFMVFLAASSPPSLGLRAYRLLLHWDSTASAARIRAGLKFARSAYLHRMPEDGCPNAERLARSEVTIEIGPSWSESLATDVANAVCELGDLLGAAQDRRWRQR